MKKLVNFSFLALLFWLFTPENSMASNVGKRYPSEKHIITDRVTGYPITVLTSSSFNDSKLYQTHESWTADGLWIIFCSNRGGNGLQLFVVNELTGDIIQLTDSPGIIGRGINLSHKVMKLFYMRGERKANGISDFQIVELNIGRLIDDSMTDKLKEASVYERIVALLPDDKPGTQMALDADETCLYWGGVLNNTPTIPRPEEPGKKNDRKSYTAYMEEMRVYFNTRGRDTNSEINKVNIQTGKIEKVLDVAFHMGHLQTNPWMPGEIIFCKETGGDADQRIWSVNADGTNYRPLYVESPDEWVTHETVSGRDELMFIISGHIFILRDKPSGIAVLNLRTNQMRLLGEAYEETPNDEVVGGYWHCNGSSDGHWAVADTHLGSIILINRTTGEQRMMSTGHPMIPDHAHPGFSPDSKRILFQSAVLTDGNHLNLMVMNLP